MAEWEPTTEDVRTAWFGLTGNTESFDTWIINERSRSTELGKHYEQERIIELLDNYTMYRFEKEWVVALIKGENK